MNFFGTGRRLTADDITRAAASIGCDEASIRAVLDVEARSSGFDSKARPTVLFEKHVFWRCLPPELRGRAQAEGLARPGWIPGAYPATSDARYEQIQRSMEIHVEAALKAASWGLGQVLGENHLSVGYATAEAMVNEMLRSEGHQLQVMVAFIRANRLDGPLRARDWKAFARGYNGPSYAKNGYDAKLAAAYRRHTGGSPRPVGDALADGVLSIGDKGPAVEALQRALVSRGHVLTVDGDYGRITRQAVEAYQRRHRLTIDGAVGPRTAASLGLDLAALSSPAPAAVTPTSVLVHAVGDDKPRPAGGGLLALLASLLAFFFRKR